MGFKADASFLKFLSMGAAGARQVMTQMRKAGFQPIELERYCTSNKIWTTKVKRLRLPDILCVRTGLRVEVRAKSDLKIRMSDAPTNPDRRWHSGLRDIDLCAFIACVERDGITYPADEAVFFDVKTLKDAEGTAQLGPPKSASEGAERDRTWPAIVPSRSGTVEAVGDGQIRVTMDADAEKPARAQTYSLKRKHSYVEPFERFSAGETFLAGSPKNKSSLSDFKNDVYSPLDEMSSKSPVDRYAAAKSLRFRKDLQKDGVAALEERLTKEDDERVLLEAAGSGMALKSAKAPQIIERFIWELERADLRMEAVLILTEIRNSDCGTILKKIVRDKKFCGDEIRQAAVWGLGKAGLKQYEELLPTINDQDRDVAMHAIGGFGKDTPKNVIDKLVGSLQSETRDEAAAASEVLRLIGGESVLQSLVAAADGSNSKGWILATLGRLEPEMVRTALAGSKTLEQVAPILLLSETENWLAHDTIDIDLKFLLKQNL